MREVSRSIACVLFAIVLSGCELLQVQPERPAGDQFTPVVTGQEEGGQGVVVSNKPISLEVVISKPQTSSRELTCYISTFKTALYGVVTEIFVIDFNQRIFEHASIAHAGAKVWENRQQIGERMPLPFLPSVGLFSYHCGGRIAGVPMNENRREAVQILLQELRILDKKRRQGGE